jgi:hypothetical protein
MFHADLRRSNTRRSSQNKISVNLRVFDLRKSAGSPLILNF